MFASEDLDALTDVDLSKEYAFLYKKRAKTNSGRIAAVVRDRCWRTGSLFPFLFSVIQVPCFFDHRFIVLRMGMDSMSFHQPESMITNSV